MIIRDPVYGADDTAVGVGVMTAVVDVADDVDGVGVGTMFGVGVGVGVPCKANSSLMAYVPTLEGSSKVAFED